MNATTTSIKPATEAEAQARAARALAEAATAIELAVRCLNEAGAWADDYASDDIRAANGPQRDLQLSADNLATAINDAATSETSGLGTCRAHLVSWTVGS